MNLKKIFNIKFLIIIGISILLLCTAYIFRKPVSTAVKQIKFSVVTSANPVKLNNEGFIIPVEAKGLPEGVHAGIYPRMELIAGALSQTDWNSYRRPIKYGNRYYRDVKTYFSFYRKHKAIQLTEKYISSGALAWDHLPNMIFLHGELPFLITPKKYPESILQRIINSNDLNSLAPAFSDLSMEMNFPGFFEAHRNEFQGYVDKAAKDFDAQKVIAWINDFYGVKDEGDFYLVFAPSIFPYRDNQVNVPGPEGKVAIVRAGTENKDEAVFPSGTDLSLLALHEWCHFYANPYIEINDALLKINNIDNLYKPVQSLVYRQGYRTVSAFFEEQLLRGTAALAAKDLYGDKVYQDAIKKSTKDYYYLTAFTAEQLDYYRKNKDKFKNLEEFTPYLLEQFKINKDNLLKLAP